MPLPPAAENSLRTELAALLDQGVNAHFYLGLRPSYKARVPAQRRGAVSPTADELAVVVSPREITPADVKRLYLGFEPNEAFVGTVSRNEAGKLQLFIRRSPTTRFGTIQECLKKFCTAYSALTTPSGLHQAIITAGTGKGSGSVPVKGLSGLPSPDQLVAKGGLPRADSAYARVLEEISAWQQAWGARKKLSGDEILAAEAALSRIDSAAEAWQESLGGGYLGGRTASVRLVRKQITILREHLDDAAARAVVDLQENAFSNPRAWRSTIRAIARRLATSPSDTAKAARDSFEALASLPDNPNDQAFAASLREAANLLRAFADAESESSSTVSAEELSSASQVLGLPPIAPRPNEDLDEPEEDSQEDSQESSWGDHPIQDPPPQGQILQQELDDSQSGSEQGSQANESQVAPQAPPSPKVPPTAARMRQVRAALAEVWARKEQLDQRIIALHGIAEPDDRVRKELAQIEVAMPRMMHELRALREQHQITEAEFRLFREEQRAPQRPRIDTVSDHSSPNLPPSQHADDDVSQGPGPNLPPSQHDDDDSSQGPGPNLPPSQHDDDSSQGPGPNLPPSQHDDDSSQGPGPSLPSSRSTNPRPQVQPIASEDGLDLGSDEINTDTTTTSTVTGTTVTGTTDTTTTDTTTTTTDTTTTTTDTTTTTTDTTTPPPRRAARGPRAPHALRSGSEHSDPDHDASASDEDDDDNEDLFGAMPVPPPRPPPRPPPGPPPRAADLTGDVHSVRQAKALGRDTLQELYDRQLAVVKRVQVMEAEIQDTPTRSRYEELSEAVVRANRELLTFDQRISAVIQRFKFTDEELNQFEETRDAVRAQQRAWSKELAKEAEKRKEDDQKALVAWKNTIGAKIGNYTIGGNIGQGGFSPVAKISSNQENDPPLVLKLPDPERLVRSQRAMLHEAAVYQRLGAHPNIARCGGMQKVKKADGGEIEGLVVEQIDGKDLKHSVDDMQVLLAANVITIGQFWGALRPLVRGALEGLRHMHASGLGHADIKPANIMFDMANGRAVLIDMGLAKEEDEDARGGTRGYNPAMMRDPRENGPVEKAREGLDLFAIGQTMRSNQQKLVKPAAARRLQPTTAQATLMMKLIRREQLDRGSIDEALADPFFTDADPQEEKDAMKAVIKALRAM